MSPTESLSTIVLAGGESSRMGQDKALLQIHGIPLLQRICLAASAISTQIKVVTAWGDRYQTILPAECQIIPETEPGQGPMVGFVQGLATVETDWVLLLACDLPQLSEATLQDWLPQLERVPEAAIACLPRQQKGWEPLCGFYRSLCLPRLRAFMQPGGRSFQRWLASEPVQELQVSDPTVLFNCNTPEEWQSLQLNG